MKQRTLTILKPDTVARRNWAAVIVDRLEQEGFEILGAKRLQLDRGPGRRRSTPCTRERPFYRQRW